MVKTHKKNFSTKTNIRKSKKMHGGALKAIAKAAGQNEKCNLAIDPYSKNESKLYSGKKLEKKLKKLPFIKAEQQLFQDRFKENLNAICVKEETGKYLKFCSNLLNCMKAPNKFYEVLHDVFNIDEKQPLTKQLYDNKKKLVPGLSMNKFIEDEKKARIKAMAKFMVDVIFKSIIEYERKHPPEKKNPQHVLGLKTKLDKLFKDLNMDFDLKKINEQDLIKVLNEKEVSIIDYYQARTSAGTEKIDTISNKDKRTPTFLKIFIGLIASIVIIETGWFDAPPGVPGGIS
jgi:hypothetical protein